MKSIGSEIRPAFRSIAPEGAITHQTPDVKQLLSTFDLFLGNHRFLGGRHKIDQRRGPRIRRTAKINQPGDAYPGDNHEVC